MCYTMAIHRIHTYFTVYLIPLLLLSGTYLQIVKCDDKFAFASYYGDHMVLQRAPQHAVLWGYGPKPGNNVTVVLSGEDPITVKVDISNTWRVILAAVKDTNPHTITAMSSAGTIMLKDVLFGDVWICSGQSNMQFTIAMVDNAEQEIADVVNYPNIRVFTAAEELSYEPYADLKSVEEVWSVPNNDTIGNKPWTYFSAVCWLYGKRLYQTMQYPIGLVASTWGGTRIEAWSDPPTLKSCGLSLERGHQKIDGFPYIDNTTVGKLSGSPNDPSVLWNAMMLPLTNMTIYGVIWYQGESNAMSDQPNTYNCSFPAMINSWRAHFYANTQFQTDPHFPFGFVQLGTWRNDSSITEGFPDIRWHQTADYGYVPNNKLPKVFMATAIDLRDDGSPWGSIHPRYKQDVADRLLLSALTVAYNKPGKKYQGPFPTRYFMDPNGKTFLITYDQDSTEIEVRTTEGFEVCCSEVITSSCSPKDSTWVPAPITDYDKQTVSISYSGCASPYVVAIRYAWSETPCPFKKCAVYSVENSLPAPPFIQLIGHQSNKLLRYNDKTIIPQIIHKAEEKLSFEVFEND